MLVFAAADQNPHSRTVRGTFELVVNDCHIEVELTGVLGLKLSCFELDDEITQLLDVEEQQVNVIVVLADFEVDLSSHEGEPGPQLV